jgi:NADH:ubiquinone oxidoreductase subunit 6 (subunit J)
VIDFVSNLFTAVGNAVRFLALDVWPITLAVLLGGGAVYVLLPRPRPYPSRWGVLLAGAALVAAGAFVVRAGVMTAESLLFYIFSGTALLAGGLLVTQHNPARAALSFALVILSVCGLFLLLAAPFLMAATVIVYAGAIIVTFLFVLMLAQQSGQSDADARSREPLLATLTGFVLLGALVYVLQATYQKGDAVRVIDALLARTRQEAQAGSEAGNAGRVQLFLEEELRPLIEKTSPAEQRRPQDKGEIEELQRQIDAALSVAPPAGADDGGRRDALARVEAVLLRARQRHGLPQPDPHRGVLSPLSGPPSNTRPEDVRVGPDGRPRMPHENSGYLGRSLFTDFLLPVELGGVLLLVAVVGAVAIAHRRTPPGRPT